MQHTNDLDSRLTEHTLEPVYTAFADINLSELVCAVKVSQSYKVVNKNANGDSVTEYINERSYYGSRPSLGQNSILLFIYLHFLNPSAYGHVFLSVSDASAFLGITKKSIRSNLRSLMQRGYILYEPNEKGFYDVSILSYASRNDSVSEGGRGYISIPFSVFEEMSKTNRAENINELRMQIRGFLSCLPGKNKDRYDGISIRNLKKNFPSYVRKKDIKRLLMTDTILNFFHVKINSAFCYLRAKEDFNFMNIKQDYVAQNLDTVKITVQDALKQYSSSGFSFTETDYHDIAKISLRYDIKDVIQGIWTLFANYVSSDVHGKVGALIRALTEECALNRLILSS